MVATRRGAKMAPEVAPAPANTLNAPPKRGGRKKAVAEDAAPAPPPAATKPIKTTAVKRKAKAEPETAELPLAKKPATTKATRAAKVETKAEPAPEPKRATRGKKVAEPVAAEEPVVEEVLKPAATRSRKAAVKKTPAPKIEEPVAVEEPEPVPEPVVEEPIVEEAPKPASKGRKAPAKKTAPTKAVKAAVIEAPVVVEPAKPATRVRKAAAPNPSLPAPVAASRPTRSRNATAAPMSPLKAPARKPAKKAAAVVAKPAPAPVEEPFAEYPGYPTTPAHIAAPLTSRRAMAELPNYPNTPAHIRAPMSTKDALAALPGYPQTPAHIVAPMGSKAALAELPGYPKTPAHIKAPISVQAAMAELPGYPKTPAHITAPVLPITIDNDEVMQDLSEYVNTPVQVDAADTEDEIMMDVPEISTTPLHAQMPLVTEDAHTEVPGSPQTSVHVQTPVKAQTPAQAHIPVQAQTPVRVQTPLSARRVLAELPIDYVGTPAPTAIATPTTIGLGDLPVDCFATPAHLSSPVIAEDAAVELSEGPRTPQQIVWGVTNQEAFNELPEYPRTPTHINAPVSNKDALAELPSYPATPAMALEAALQEEITASVKKQTPSPLHLGSLADVSFEYAEASEITDYDLLDDTEVSVAEPTAKLQFAPIKLAPPQISATLPVPEMASPKKSALRSPQKLEAKTPKKAVTWGDKEESELFLYDGPRPLQGLTFFVDITSHGKPHNYVYATLLEDLGAKIAQEWTNTGITHVLFKDGSVSTLELVIASKGATKCVNLGWVLACESNKQRVDETDYLVDLSPAMLTSPTPSKTLNTFTPARTPSRYALPPSSECKSLPTTPTSSEFDRSINVEDDDKENSEVGVFFQGFLGVKNQAPRTCPPKKSSMLMSRSPMKTPSKPSFLAAKPFSTTKKRSLESSFPSFSLSAPPKKLRLF